MAERCRKRVNLKLFCDGKECIYVSKVEQWAAQELEPWSYIIMSSFFSVAIGNFQVQPYNRKYKSIGHRVSLNILTELSVN